MNSLFCFSLTCSKLHITVFSGEVKKSVDDIEKISRCCSSLREALSEKKLQLFDQNIQILHANRIDRIRQSTFKDTVYR